MIRGGGQGLARRRARVAHSGERNCSHSALGSTGSRPVPQHQSNLPQNQCACDHVTSPNHDAVGFRALHVLPAP